MTKRRFLDYEPAPFYFLNDNIDRDELILQLDFMQEHGIPAFFLHVRDGITGQAWGTDVFYSHVRFIADEAMKRGITVWLYDEDSFPSGQCGGQIAIERPELIGKNLRVMKINAKAGEVERRVLGRVKGLYAYAVTEKDGVESVKTLKNCFGPVRRYWYRIDHASPYFGDMCDVGMRYEHVRALTAFPEMMFEAEVDEDCTLYVVYADQSTSGKYAYRVDLLKKETFYEYKRIILDRYEECLGEFFGNKIRGIFMDEPTVGCFQPLYSEALCEYFEEKHGYRAEDHFYKLSSEYEGECDVFRRHYVEAAMELFEKSFMEPLAKWCREHSLLLTGHFGGEETLHVQSICSQNIYRQTRYLDVPGFDIITTNIGNLEYPSLVFGANMVVSSAAQCGRSRILAECFGVSPYNMGYEGLKKTTDWLFVCGINWLIPHGFHYGYSCYQRCDAGKSFFFQDPYFEDYKRVSQYAGRVGKLLLEYERPAGILLIGPDSAFNEETPSKPGKRGMRRERIKKRFASAIRHLMKEHIAWDYADTKAAFDGEIADGNLVIGQRAYSKVIVVEGGDVEASAAEHLGEMGVDCSLFNGSNTSVFPCGLAVEGDGERVQIYKKQNESGELIFAFNNSDSYTRVKVFVGEGNVWLYDGEEDISLRVNTENGFAEISMQSYQACILLRRDEPWSEVAGEYLPEEEKVLVPEYVKDPQWTYLPRGARCAISYYNLKIERGGEVTDCGEVRRNPLREIIGTHDTMFRGDYYQPSDFDRAKRFYNTYPCNAIYTVTLDCADGGDYLLFDKHSIEGSFRVFWNGAEIPRELFVKKRVYDMSNIAIYPRWQEGENTLEIRVENAGEFDGASGDIYLMKKED